MIYCGKKIFITGSTGYIGRKIVDAFVHEGGIVSICGRSISKCEEIAKKINKTSGRDSAYPIELDVRNYQCVKKAIDKFATKAGGIDILINCAGGGSRENRNTLESQNIDLICKIVDTNLMGTIYCCKEALKYFPSTGGCIVNIASIHGHMGMEYYSEYSAAKGGVLAFTKALAKEQAHKNIRVNSVSYGLINLTSLLFFVST